MQRSTATQVFKTAASQALETATGLENRGLGLHIYKHCRLMKPSQSMTLGHRCHGLDQVCCTRQKGFMAVFLLTAEGSSIGGKLDLASSCLSARELTIQFAGAQPGCSPCRLGDAVQHRQGHEKYENEEAERHPRFNGVAHHGVVVLGLVGRCASITLPASPHLNRPSAMSRSCVNREATVSSARRVVIH